MVADRRVFEEVLERLEPLGDVTGEAMFGGFGFWEAGDMFGLIDGGGRLHLKVDDESVQDYRDAGGEPFQPRMAGGRQMTSRSYWTVPDEVLADGDGFVAWARRAVDVGHATARRKPARPRSG